VRGDDFSIRETAGPQDEAAKRQHQQVQGDAHAARQRAALDGVGVRQEFDSVSSCRAVSQVACLLVP
jgi:hypothetical protein